MLKYIKLFEAFESDKLNKIFSFLDSAPFEKNPNHPKNSFLKDLMKIAKSADFPESKFDDSYFQVLGAGEALKLTVELKREVCTAKSDSVFYDDGIEGEVCRGGSIYRRWGKGKRLITCPNCSGTGYEPLIFDPTGTNIFGSDVQIKWIKFWFSSMGEYLGYTGTNGISNEEILVKRPRTSWRDTKTEPFKFKLDMEYPICLNIPIGHYVSLPSGLEVPTLLYDSYISIREKGSMRATWGKALDLKKNADFAIVLDYSKINPIIENNPIKKSDIQLKRKEEKKEATALMSDEEIKKLNIARYTSKVLDGMKISVEFPQIKNNLIRIMGGNFFIGWYVLCGKNFEDLYRFINYMYELIEFVNVLETKDFEKLKEYSNKIRGWDESKSEEENFEMGKETFKEHIDFVQKFLRDEYSNSMKYKKMITKQFTDTRNSLLDTIKSEHTGEGKLTLTEHDKMVEIAKMNLKILGEIEGIRNLINSKLGSLPIESLSDMELFATKVEAIYGNFKRRLNPLSKVVSNFGWLGETAFYGSSGRHELDTLTKKDYEIFKSLVSKI